MFKNDFDILPDLYRIEVWDLDYFDGKVVDKTVTSLDDFSISLYKDIPYQVNVTASYVSSNFPDKEYYSFVDIGKHNLHLYLANKTGGNIIEDEYGNIMTAEPTIITNKHTVSKNVLLPYDGKRPVTWEP